MADYIEYNLAATTTTRGYNIYYEKLPFRSRPRHPNPAPPPPPLPAFESEWDEVEGAA